MQGGSLNWWNGARGRLAPLASVSPAAAGVPALDRRLRAGLWLLLVVFSLSGVFGHSLWGGNDTREGGMIWDMVRHGTLVTPTIDGRPFLEKPPLLHWTGVAICSVAGRVTEGLVRLPAALYGLGTLALLVLFVRGPRAAGGFERGREIAAWGAAFLCGTAIEFQEYARIVLTDMALVFMVTLSLVTFWRAYQRPGAARWFAYLLAASASFYAKGLVGPALIWSSVGIFLLWKRRFRLLAGLAAAYVPVFLLAVVPWVLALDRFGGMAALRFVFWDNQIGRFFNFGDRSLPHDPFFINKERWYYYLVHLPVYLAPWTLLLVPAAIAWVRRSSPFRTSFHAFVASAVAGMALVLQASSAKVASYALPVYPFLFAAVALWLAELLARGRPTWLERWSIRTTAAVVGLVLGLVPAVFIAGTFVRPDLFRVGGRMETAAGFVLAAVVLTLLAAAALVIVRLLRSPARTLVCAAGPASYALIVIVALQLVTPAIDRHRSYRPIAALAADELGHGVTVALGTQEYRDVGAFTFYLDRRLPLLPTGGGVASFLQFPEPRAVIVPRDELPALEVRLAGVPHGRLSAGAPGTLSRAWVILVNGAEQVATGRAPAGREGGAVLAQGPGRQGRVWVDGGGGLKAPVGWGARPGPRRAPKRY
ncbi:MAG TPA: phospholipid carrier-dependent glycosyltransferase [Thermoanaerobaculaceae bacterium]|nr:phospholipid carrier-dependent glycosyltransferase [Thermoanaerobaculaceae bacterium]